MATIVLALMEILLAAIVVIAFAPSTGEQLAWSIWWSVVVAVAIPVAIGAVPALVLSLLRRAPRIAFALTLLAPVALLVIRIWSDLSGGGFVY